MLPLRPQGMSKRILLGALAGLVVGAVIGASIGMVLAGPDPVSRAILLGSIGILVGLIGGAVAAEPKKVFGSSNDRELKRLRPLIAQVNAHEEALKELSDEDLRAKTAAFREQLRQQTERERAELERLRAALRRIGCCQARPRAADTVELASARHTK